MPFAVAAGVGAVAGLAGSALQANATSSAANQKAIGAQQKAQAQERADLAPWIRQARAEARNHHRRRSADRGEWSTDAATAAMANFQSAVPVIGFSCNSAQGLRAVDASAAAVEHAPLRRRDQGGANLWRGASRTRISPTTTTGFSTCRSWVKRGGQHRCRRYLLDGHGCRANRPQRGQRSSQHLRERGEDHRQHRQYPGQLFDLDQNALGPSLGQGALGFEPRRHRDHVGPGLGGNTHKDDRPCPSSRHGPSRTQRPTCCVPTRSPPLSRRPPRPRNRRSATSPSTRPKLGIEQQQLDATRAGNAALVGNGTMPGTTDERRRTNGGGGRSGRRRG